MGSARVIAPPREDTVNLTGRRPSVKEGLRRPGSEARWSVGTNDRVEPRIGRSCVHPAYSPHVVTCYITNVLSAERFGFAISDGDNRKRGRGLFACNVEPLNFGGIERLPLGHTDGKGGRSRNFANMIVLDVPSLMLVNACCIPFSKAPRVCGMLME